MKINPNINRMKNSCSIANLKTGMGLQFKCWVLYRGHIQDATYILKLNYIAIVDISK